MASIPWPYIAFFQWIEPVVTAAGAVFAWFMPQTYLEWTHAASAPGILGLPLGTNVALRQLGNMYCAFAISEGWVLRTTNDIKVWRAFLTTLLIADIGHLLACYPLGVNTYYDVSKWGAMSFGNYFFVYCGAAIRICFLLQIGMGGGRKAKAKAKKSIKAAQEELEPVTPAAMNKTPAQSTRRKRTKAAS